MGRVTRRSASRSVTVADAGLVVDGRADTLAVEEPLEIRIDGRAVTVTMRTPGDDFDLALGWLAAEGQITSATDVRTLMHCLDTDATGAPTYNVVDVSPAPGSYRSHAALNDDEQCVRCGGAENIAAVRQHSRYDLGTDQVRLDPSVIVDLPRRLRADQQGFARTGGMHAAGIFTADGELLCLREDFGRHNAVDKVVGWALREDRLPLRGCVLVVSGRAGFELVQKAIMAGIPAMAAVSASTTLAVDLARSAGLTLMAFVRDPRLTVYSDPGRLIGVPDAPGHRHDA